MSLKDYRKKRTFTATKEPKGKKSSSHKSSLIFVIHEHHARHLHFDLRLELDGVLKSFAVPKGPPETAEKKRLAIEVEDHPLEYATFEGTIPEGQYGAGQVIIWDEGTYATDPSLERDENEKSLRKQFKQGLVHIHLKGSKLKGEYILTRLKQSEEEKQNQWLFIKKRNEEQTAEKSEKNFVTHQDKIFWPKEKLSKGDLLNYYESVSQFILPYLKDRPLVLDRYPDGIEGKHFFQKEAPAFTPSWVQTTKVPHSEGAIRYLLAQDLKSMLFAVNLGSIELHVFSSRIQHLEKPDYLVLDLDPVDLPFNYVVEVALEAHEFLQTIKIPSYCKTSGKRGLHIYIPLNGKYSYSQVETFSEILAKSIHKTLPKITSLIRSPAHRKKRVYIDFLQNNRTKTMVVSYGVRPIAGAPVSTPLEWKEVNANLDPKQFNITNMKARLEKKGDLFKPVLGKGINILKALELLT